jgi:cyanophycinase
MRRVVAILGLVGLPLAMPLAAQPANGPGSLLIIGGGPRPQSVLDRFVQLAGGAQASILVLPMASADADGAGESGARAFQRAGAGQVRSLILTREQASSADVAREFEGVTGIYFPGGVQSRLAAVFDGTPAEEAIREVYRRGGVVGGTSAGAAVMTSPMITGDERRPGGDRPDSSQAWITIDRDNVGTAPGFELLPGAIVDQHFVRRRRHNRLMSLVLENPALIGAGIDESTAIEVRPDGTWAVLGESVVVIYDAREARIAGTSSDLGAAGVRMHVLPGGSTFDPRTGRATIPEG